MRSNLKIYTSFVSPWTFPIIVEKNLLPILVVRNISNSEVVGKYSGSAIHFRDLAPSTELYRHKRDGLITNDEYQKRYALEMSHVNLEKTIRTWELLRECSGADGIVILGYGSREENCHRGTLSLLLNESGLLETKVMPLIL